MSTTSQSYDDLLNEAEQMNLPCFKGFTEDKKEDLAKLVQVNKDACALEPSEISSIDLTAEQSPKGQAETLHFLEKVCANATMDELKDVLTKNNVPIPDGYKHKDLCKLYDEWLTDKITNNYKIPERIKTLQMGIFRGAGCSTYTVPQLKAFANELGLTLKKTIAKPELCREVIKAQNLKDLAEDLSNRDLNWRNIWTKYDYGLVTSFVEKNYPKLVSFDKEHMILGLIAIKRGASSLLNELNDFKSNLNDIVSKIESSTSQTERNDLFSDAVDLKAKYSPLLDLLAAIKTYVISAADDPSKEALKTTIEGMQQEFADLRARITQQTTGVVQPVGQRRLSVPNITSADLERALEDVTRKVQLGSFETPLRSTPSTGMVRKLETTPPSADVTIMPPGSPPEIIVIEEETPVVDEPSKESERKLLSETSKQLLEAVAKLKAANDADVVDVDLVGELMTEVEKRREAFKKARHAVKQVEKVEPGVVSQMKAELALKLVVLEDLKNKLQTSINDAEDFTLIETLTTKLRSNNERITKLRKDIKAATTVDPVTENLERKKAKLQTKKRAANTAEEKMKLIRSSGTMTDEQLEEFARLASTLATTNIEVEKLSQEIAAESPRSEAEISRISIVRSERRDDEIQKRKKDLEVAKEQLAKAIAKGELAVDEGAKYKYYLDRYNEYTSKVEAAKEKYMATIPADSPERGLLEQISKLRAEIYIMQSLLNELSSDSAQYMEQAEQLGIKKRQLENLEEQLTVERSRVPGTSSGSSATVVPPAVVPPVATIPSAVKTFSSKAKLSSNITKAKDVMTKLQKARDDNDYDELVKLSQELSAVNEDIGIFGEDVEPDSPPPSQTIVSQTTVSKAKLNASMEKVKKATEALEKASSEGDYAEIPSLSADLETANAELSLLLQSGGPSIVSSLSISPAKKAKVLESVQKVKDAMKKLEDATDSGDFDQIPTLSAAVSTANAELVLASQPEETPIWSRETGFAPAIQEELKAAQPVRVKSIPIKSVAEIEESLVNITKPLIETSVDMGNLKDTIFDAIGLMD